MGVPFTEPRRENRAGRQAGRAESTGTAAATGSASGNKGPARLETGSFVEGTREVGEE